MVYETYDSVSTFLPANATYITTAETSSSCNFYYTITDDVWKNPWAKEENEVDRCHLCKAELEKRNTYEWRVLDCDCEEGDKCECDDYLWKKETIKTYECGTIVREGDLDEDTKRVTLGKGCIELGA